MPYFMDLQKNKTNSPAVSPSWLWETGSPGKKIQILALGDVGQTVATALSLLGNELISSIGLYDANPNAAIRLEMELNQIQEPFCQIHSPCAHVLSFDELFDCDIFIFCASKGIPDLQSNVTDVRMAQFDANKEIISYYGQMAASRQYKGLFAVVSDPVDPLCKAALLSSNGQLNVSQIQGYGLGVMNARAIYYANKDPRFSMFIKEGRAFGPHGQDLVIANSIEHYDDTLSVELTNLTIQANLRVRELGYKPYLAPAISSAALSILKTIRGEWHYSSNYLDGVFFGSNNRTTNTGVEWENLFLPDSLFTRIQKAYTNLEAIL